MTYYMPILDVHTHNQNAENAVISCNPHEFNPQNGKYYSIGIHPWHSEEFSDEIFNKVAELATLDTVVAIGECGIDALRGSTIEQQVIQAQLHARLAEKVRKPLILHCVRTGNFIINLHRKLRPIQPWIIHGFRGTSGLATSLLGCQGIYLSYGEHFNPQAVEVTPVSHILVETDESTLPITEIAEKISKIKGCMPHELYAYKIFNKQR